MQNLNPGEELGAGLLDKIVCKLDAAVGTFTHASIVKLEETAAAVWLPNCTLPVPFNDKAFPKGWLVITDPETETVCVVAFVVLIEIVPEGEPVLAAVNRT